MSAEVDELAELSCLAERESIEFVSRTVQRSPKFDWSPSGVREEWRTVTPRGCQAVH